MPRFEFRLYTIFTKKAWIKRPTNLSLLVADDFNKLRLVGQFAHKVVNANARSLRSCLETRKPRRGGAIVNSKLFIVNRSEQQSRLFWSQSAKKNEQ